ncbi:unnamed protein product [Medioppia subpectinata]|uniref:Mitochondrial cytochrome c oxidase subunit VIc/VIIs domain-containing protein n=1 Tax=Medioppia subpectinata TaxID=1979941 RepID=A0A7R9L631_9ACAR|nr:unnamed protein product [Medioppia subpectinata]CAG2116190.1 unnamed protein product [Medioppia subpectinata]
MANTAVTGGRIPKPVLRGHAHAFVRRHLFISIGLSLVGAIAWKYAVAEPRKRTYAEFYKNYDVEKEEQRLIALGLYDNPFLGDE